MDRTRSPPFKNNTSPAQVPTFPKIESETQRSLLTLANILAYKVGFRSIFEVLCRYIVLRCAWVSPLPLLIRSTQPTGLHTKLTLMVRLGERPYRVWVNVCLFFWFTINDPMESKLKSQYPESKLDGETPPLRKEGYTYF